jgi:hypothetical protein
LYFSELERDSSETCQGKALKQAKCFADYQRCKEQHYDASHHWQETGWRIWCGNSAVILLILAAAAFTYSHSSEMLGLLQRVIVVRQPLLTSALTAVNAFNKGLKRKDGHGETPKKAFASLAQDS